MPPPLSPRHYDKYTYSLRRKPEKDSSPNTRGPHGSQNFRPRTQYEAAIAGIAPLALTDQGFCVAEDGTISSRFVSPARRGAPAVALVSVPVTVTTRATPDSQPTAVTSVAIAPVRNIMEGSPRNSVQYTATPFSPDRSLGGALRLSGTILAPTTDVAASAAGSEWQAWKRFTAIALKEFSEEELVALSWDAVHDLLIHYKMNSPVEIAKVQLAWKRKQGLLPSDYLFSPDRSVGVEQGPATFYVPAAMAQVSDSSLLQSGLSSRLAADDRPHSPRRGGRFVPGYRSPLRWNASPKVDTGSVKRHQSPSAPRTPTSPR